MNHVVLIGRLGRDPDVRYTTTGTPVCNGSLAATRRRKVGEEWKDDTTWVEFAIFGPRGEAFAKYHRKGDLALMTNCWLKLDEWADKATGEKRSRMKVVVEEWEFAQGRRSDDQVPTSGEGTPPISQDETPF